MTLARRVPIVTALVTLGIVTAGCGSAPSKQDALDTAAGARTHLVSENP